MKPIAVGAEEQSQETCKRDWGTGNQRENQDHPYHSPTNVS